MSTGQAGISQKRLVSLAGEEGVKQVLCTTILGLWDLVNNLLTLSFLLCTYRTPSGSGIAPLRGHPQSSSDGDA